METRVAVLADKPAAEYPDTLQATAYLIECARENKLVAMVCTHAESNKPATIICAMEPIPENPSYAQYVPLAMLFTEGNSTWMDYLPPESATKGPLDALEEFDLDEPTLEDLLTYEQFDT